MLFNSFEYILFLPLVYILYILIGTKNWRFQNVLLLIASYVFYAFWSVKFLGLLVLITIMDYFYGFQVAKGTDSRRKFFLFLSVLNNLGILAIFKYFDFFMVEFQHILDVIGIKYSVSMLNLVLPIGISFYTFHGMSYVFDIYRNKFYAIRSLTDYGLFVSFFPLLVAGPIERANHLLPQIQSPRRITVSNSIAGTKLIILGMFKKVIVADNLAPLVDAIFSDSVNLDGISLITGVVLFAFQIYGDFSGYSDMAIGTAKLFGFELLSNFKFPYFSRNIAEFWKRWHISLSSWFRDYLYIPLGGSRRGLAITLRNTFYVFLLSGFWHGANWTFIVWGLIHAVAFIPALVSGERGKFEHIVAYDRSLPNLRDLFNMTLTFSIVALGWVYFRSPDIAFANSYLKRIFSELVFHPMSFLKLPHGKSGFIYIVPLLVIDWINRRDERLPKIRSKVVWLTLAFLSLIWLLISLGKENSFIYFQF
ncbi:MAG: MBOAT family O-acyltransferase [Bacteroidia bacterium]